MKKRNCKDTFDIIFIIAMIVLALYPLSFIILLGIGL